MTEPCSDRTAPSTGCRLLDHDRDLSGCSNSPNQDQNFRHPASIVDWQDWQMGISYLFEKVLSKFWWKGRVKFLRLLCCQSTNKWFQSLVIIKVIWSKLRFCKRNWFYFASKQVVTFNSSCYQTVTKSAIKFTKVFLSAFSVYELTN